MLRKLVSRAVKLMRIIRAYVSLSLVRLQHGMSCFPHDLQIAPGVRISISDGGMAFFGRNCSIDRYVTVVAKRGRISVGTKAYIGVGSVIVSRESISIGDDVLIAEQVSIRDQDHIFDGQRPTNVSGFSTAPIRIGNNVWLGAKVTVTKGVTIGNNVVVGANSVVTHDLPDNCVAAGAPARVIRRLASKQAP